MPTEESTSHSLQHWYREIARPFLVKCEDTKISELDQDLRRVEDAAKRCKLSIATCFLGNSGVGKSTLINALVAGSETVVPSGGVGPLTAQALSVRYAETPSFIATYHPWARVNRLLFAIRQSFRRELEEAGGAILTDPDTVLPQEELDDLQLPDPEAAPEANSQRDHYRKQAQLLITGHQEHESITIHELVEGLRRTLGLPPAPDIFLDAENVDRVGRLLKLLPRGEKRDATTFQMSGTTTGFSDSLKEHASGFLAPIIQNLEVQWPSELLKTGITLVDLPGLGIAGDIYREVTNKWVTKEARAVVLVVDRSGISEANAQLLRTSGFLNRLLHSAYDPTVDPVALAVAVVRLDDVAESQRRQDRSKSKAEHFAEVCHQADQMVRNQIRESLERAWTADDAVPSEAKRRVLADIVAQIQVFPLSAIQYCKCLADDEDDSPFIHNPIDTGVPAMISGLQTFARNEARRRQELFTEAYDLFCSRVTSSLNILYEQWKEGTRADADAERLREDLRSFLQPLREEYRLRQGQFRGFLKDTLPGRMNEVVSEAKLQSSKQVRNYLRRLRDAHWKTLQAAVKKGGTFHGARQIDLPRDFALTFEEPIAEQWGVTVLKDVRDRTSAFADDCVALIDQVVEWSKSQGARVRPALVEALRDGIKADAKRLKTIGRDVVGEIRELVKNNLSKAIELPIRKKCQKFVKNNEHEGTGTRNRILELFDELADDALDAAVAPTKEILSTCYQKVMTEIRNVFDQYQDPLLTAEEKIVETHEQRLKRSDAQRRKAMLLEIEAVLGGSPCETASKLVSQ